MKDKVFLDTNVLVYAKLEDEGDKEKRDTAVALIQQIQGSPIISVQVLNEFSSVLIKHDVSNAGSPATRFHRTGSKLQLQNSEGTGEQVMGDR